MTAPSPDLGTVVVDPRFRARRIAVRRQAGRRRLKRLLVLVTVAVVALSAVIVLRSPVLDVDAVAVSGHRFTPSAAVAEAAGIDVGTPLLLADLDGAEEAVEALPWVADATVHRDLPSEVRVEIDEREPAAVVAMGAVHLLVDDAGRVLEVADPATGFAAELSSGPPLVTVIPPGEGAPPAAGASVDRSLIAGISLAQRLQGDPVGAVDAVRLEPTLSLDLAGGGQADLGDATELDAKVEAFRTAHARIDLACVRSLDLRVPTHPVLTRRPGCS